MADGERDWTEKEIVLEARKKPLRSFEELMAACLPALTARLWATCCWSASLGKSWKIGDYNFLIASVSPDPQSTLYIQFWSEPLEPVLTEVCSGEWNPGAVRYLRQQQRKQLGALGYTLGGQARNFGKEVQIRTSAQAEAAAREVLAIFYDVFGYRGQWPLEVECHQGERADLDTVYSSLTPEDLTKLAAHLGFDADVVEDSDPSVVHRAGKETIRREPGRSGGRQPSLFRGGVPDPHQLRHRHRSDRVRGSRRCRPVLAGHPDGRALGRAQTAASAGRWSHDRLDRERVRALAQGLAGVRAERERNAQSSGGHHSLRRSSSPRRAGAPHRHAPRQSIEILSPSTETTDRGREDGGRWSGGRHSSPPRESARSTVTLSREQTLLFDQPGRGYGCARGFVESTSPPGQAIAVKASSSRNSWRRIASIPPTVAPAAAMSTMRRTCQ